MSEPRAGTIVRGACRLCDPRSCACPPRALLKKLLSPPARREVVESVELGCEYHFFFKSVTTTEQLCKRYCSNKVQPTFFCPLAVNLFCPLRIREPAGVMVLNWPRSCCRSAARAAAIRGKPCFRGLPCAHARACVPGPCLCAGCTRAACVGSGSRGSDMGAGGWCLTPRVGGVRWSGPARGPAHGWGRCAGGRAGGWSTRCLPDVPT